MYCTAPLDGGVGSTLSYVILCTKISNIVRPISHTIFLCLLAIASTNTVKHKHVCILHHDAFVSEKSPNLPFPSFVQNKRVFYFLAEMEQGWILISLFGGTERWRRDTRLGDCLTQLQLRGSVGTSLAFTSHMHMHIAHAINARCLTKVLQRSTNLIRSTEFIRSSGVGNRYLEHHRRLLWKPFM